MNSRCSFTLLISERMILTSGNAKMILPVHVIYFTNILEDVQIKVKFIALVDVLVLIL